MRVSTERPMRARVVVAIVAGVVGASVLAGCGGDGPVSAAAPPAPPVVLPAAPEDVAKDLAGWAEAVGPIDYVTTGYPKKIRRTKDAMVMHLIPAGTFQMGAVPGDRGAEEWEKPRHAVTLTRAYYMDESEVTVGMWRKYAAEKRASMPWLRGLISDAHPIHNVSWDDARVYAAWAGAALPTEAQWERAAKGGHDDHVYPWGASDQVRNRNGDEWDDGFDDLSPAESFPANAYGLFDMSGTVWERCSAGCDERYY